MSSNPNCLDDRCLKARCLNGEEAAWVLLDAANFPGLVSYSRTLLVIGPIPGLTPEDVAVDVFSSLCDNDRARVHHYDPDRAPWPAYLRWLTDCDLLLYRRQEKVRQEREGPLGDEEPVDWGADQGCVQAELHELAAALPPALFAAFAVECLGLMVPMASPAGSPADNRLTTDGQYTYTYDKAGNLVNKTGMEGGTTYSYDYTYDFRNRLTEVKKTRVVHSAVAADDIFTYDVFDRRIGKRTIFGTQVWTAYDGDNAYADFNGQTLTTRYVFANGLDKRLTRTDANGNSTAWYLTDNIGSVRRIVDANGNNLYHVNYFTFGGIVPGSESGSGGDRFKFAGREWDSEIGLYYNRARYYNPNTGRFTSEDPIQFHAGDANLYRYVANSPSNGTDPTGEVDWGTVIGTAVVGAVAGIAIVVTVGAATPIVIVGAAAGGGLLGGAAAGAITAKPGERLHDAAVGGLAGAGIGAAIGVGFCIFALPAAPFTLAQGLVMRAVLLSRLAALREAGDFEGATGIALQLEQLEALIERHYPGFLP